MTDEQDFRDAIEANPACSLTKLLYADFLDDNGNPLLAEGYRAISQCKLSPVKFAGEFQWYNAAREDPLRYSSEDYSEVPSAWFNAMIEYDRGLNHYGWTTAFEALEALASSWVAVPHNAKEDILGTDEDGEPVYSPAKIGVMARRDLTGTL